MAFDLNDSGDVQSLVDQLRGQGVSLIIIDTLDSHVRGSTLLVEAADNVIDASNLGEATFMKKRDGTFDPTVDEYFIWSNEHRAWWRAGGRGYSSGLREAGKYTREHALRICREAIFSSMHVGIIAEIPVRAADIADFLKGQVIPSSIVAGAE